MVTAHFAHSLLNRRAILAWTLIGAALASATGVRAASGATNSCTVSSTCTVGEYLYDDTYTPITTGTCTLTSKYPDGTSHLSSQSMTGTSDGWYQYQFTAPTTTGYYRAQVCCTVGSDLLCLDKSFEVASSISSLSTSDVASAVWGYSSRTMTGFGSLVSDIWSNVSSGGTTSQSTTINNINNTLQADRVLLEQLINRPVIENAIVEQETVDLDSKLDETEDVISRLHLNTQLLASQTGVAILKAEGVPAQITDLIGLPTDSASTNTIYGNLSWLSQAWKWDIVGALKDQVAAVKLALANQNWEEAAEYSATLEKMLGSEADQASDSTLYGQLKATSSMLGTLNNLDSQAERLLRQEQGSTSLWELIKQVLASNRIPDGQAVLGAASSDEDKLLGMKSLITLNKQFLAMGAKTTLANTWTEQGGLTFKTALSNPSKSISQTVPLKYYLPTEVKKENVLALDDGLVVKYDIEKNQFFVQGEYLLKPGETKVVAVKVSDIWTTTNEEIASLRRQTAELAKPLEKTPFFAQSVALTSDINVALDKITANQAKAKTTAERIRAFRENAVEINGVQTRLEKLKDLVTLASSNSNLLGFVGGTQTIAVWGLILVILAGFVLMVTYLRSLTKVQPQEEKLVLAAVHESPKGTRRSLGVLVLTGAVSAGLTGGLTWRLLPKTGDLFPAASLINPVISDNKPALGMGGPDVVRIAVPAGGSINLRIAPSVKADVVVKLNKTTEAIRLAENGLWVQVALDDSGKQAWVAKEYIQGPNYKQSE